MVHWFLFDLGNTIIKLAYERVLENICRDAAVERDDLVDLLEAPGGYRDLERGAVTFFQFLPPSRVTNTGPSFDPDHSTLRSRGDSAIA